MAVSRLGIHKFSTANRNYGFELHIARSQNIRYPFQKGHEPFWKPDMASIPWEEALRAWRIVQPTLFRRIYVTPQTDPLAIWLDRIPIVRHVNTLRPKLYRLSEDARISLKDYPWFMPGILAGRVAKGVEVRAVYYTGNYLTDMLFTLLSIQYALLVPLAIKTGQDVFAMHWSAIYEGIILGSMLLIIFFRGKRIRRRREILEHELLSIHSCAIVWQAVTLIHHRALSETGGLYDHYTENVARLASDLGANVFKIHEWLARPEKHVA